MKKKISIILSVVLLLTMCIVACNTSLANPLVIGTEYSAVSSNYHATQAAFEVLQNGGNAADAAFTLAATIGIAECWFSGALSGGTWALYYDASSDKVYALDAQSVGPVLMRQLSILEIRMLNPTGCIKLWCREPGMAG